jgi:hypothetical protein
MKVALKEWAVVVEAVTTGRQILLLRKGGIAEGKRGFEIQHERFLFFPTWEHQHAEAIRPEFRELWDRVRPADPDQVQFRCLGKVRDVVHAPASREEFRALEARHIWGERSIRMRYEYRPDLPLFVVIVQAYVLTRPVVLPNDRRYRGCRSWVELDEDVAVDDATPVLGAEEFAESRRALLQELAGGSQNRAETVL